MVATSGNAVCLTASDREGRDMDFNSAILSHKRWKERIRQTIESGEVLDAGVIAKDDACELGKWIQTAPAAQRSLQEYQVVREKHARFHQVAADTVRRIPGLPKAEAEALLVGTTAYGMASAACVTAIAALRDKLQK
jgi:methyl-accepting chemotaxis protein